MLSLFISHHWKTLEASLAASQIAILNYPQGPASWSVDNFLMAFTGFLIGWTVTRFKLPIVQNRRDKFQTQLKNNGSMEPVLQ